MPNLYTLTGDVNDLVGGASVASTAHAYLESNIKGDDALTVTSEGGGLRLGTIPVSVEESSGLFSRDQLVGSDSTDLNVEPGVLQYRLIVEYRDPGIRAQGSKSNRTYRSGWFFLNASDDIKNLPKSVNPVVAATGAEIIAAASDEADRAEAAAELAVAPTDTQVATLAQDPLSETGQALSATYAAGKFVPGRLAGATLTAAGTTPRAVDKFDGYLWGTEGGNIYRSTDGTTWALYCPTPGGAGSLYRLIPTADGEVVASSTTNVYKSSGWATGTPTWATKVTRNASATFNQFNMDGDGTKFIASQYASPTRPDSRYAHISVDGGDTWTVAYDSVTLHGAAANSSHIHGCCYDPWADRFYISEGHSDGGDIAGVYYSDDDGATWTRPTGTVMDPAPMALRATDDGIVCGCDYADGGMYGIARAEDPDAETLRQLLRHPGQAPGVVLQAMRAFRDLDGIVYTAFQPATGTAPIITAGTATSQALLWEGAPATVAGDGASEAVAIDGEVIATVTDAGAAYILRGKLPTRTSPTPAQHPLSGSTTDGTSLAIGRTSSVVDRQSVAIGEGATVLGSDGIDAVALGFQAYCNGTQNMVALGAKVRVGSNSMVVSANLDTTAYTSVTVIGQTVTVTGNNATAIGALAKAAAAAVAVGQNAQATHSSSSAIGAGVATTAANQVALGAKHIELTELGGDPAAPAANNGRLYFKDDGAGNTILCVRTSSGVKTVTLT